MGLHASRIGWGYVMRKKVRSFRKLSPVIHFLTRKWGPQPNVKAPHFRIDTGSTELTRRTTKYRERIFTPLLMPRRRCSAVDMPRSAS